MFRRATLRLLTPLALLPALLAGGCTAPPAPVDGTERAERAVEGTLDGWSAAFLARDEARYLELDHRPGARATFADAAQVPLAAWDYRAGSVRVDGNRAFVSAELSYRITGYDARPLVSAREVELRRGQALEPAATAVPDSPEEPDDDGKGPGRQRDGGWYVVADRPGPGSHPLLWEQGPVTAVHGTPSLVLGVGQDRALLTGVAADADRAVPAVRAVWPRPWSGRLLVQVPESVAAMAQLLGSPASSFTGMAAVTTSPGDRVTINPEAYRRLGDVGRQVVITHEAVHVATRDATTQQTPLWLSEGFADYVAYRATGRPPRQIAPALTRAVRAGALPATLPDASQFAFAGDADALARAYEGAWLAVRMLAERWGEAKLVSFYETAGRSPDAAFAQLGLLPADFTSSWRDYLRTQLG
ncbi:hypothetical protein [Streptomyces sp. NRRL S-87]|uniref:hypothetical protein n=1 Tax=Streptomyces sp. NRRL S-87 TaxID=1463920 RepID=UPI00099D25BC|nr:hypothetical protein [Streptomyces sp. NRRL S-87]